MRLPKAFCQLTLAFLVILLLAVPAQAQEARFRLGQRSYMVDGRSYQMDAAPYAAAGRTYVPVRYLALALGVPEAGIRWDSAARTVTLQKADITLRLQVGSRTMVISKAGAAVSLLMEVAPQVKAGRLCLPARYVAAGLGYTAGWEAATRTVVLQPGAVPVVQVLRFDPNPVAPEGALTITAQISSPVTGAPVVRLRGAGGPASQEPLDGYWQNTDQITLRPAGPDEWGVGCIAPATAGIYPAAVIVDGLTSTAPGWLLKVYPEGFLNQPGYATPEEAIHARFAHDFKGCTLKKLTPRPLLLEDKRDPAYHKLFDITYYQPYAGPILPSGTHTYFYYVLRDGPGGPWRVLSGGTGP
ncbi:MAG: copper amine oxidase N-terminal domain-containing protein [Bacillota bacterium]